MRIHSQDAPMLGHVSGAAAAFDLSAEDSPPPDKTIADGDTISFGNISLKVIHTPGHSPGGVALLSEADGCVFVGDTLFAGSIGRTDFPGGDYETLLTSVREKIFTLPDDTTIYSGHGPATTVGNEKQHNPFFR